jgi:formiminotetrahydrofolate cyclodeaminase
MGFEMKDFEAWLTDLSTKSLPGGVAAAAMAAAMGAGLVAKVARLLARLASRQAQTGRPASEPDQQALEELHGLAMEAHARLRALADRDSSAYRRVLATQRRSPTDPRRREAERAAIETPIEVAERCQALLIHLSGLADRCGPDLQVDLQVGRSLLQVGVEAGLLAATTNLRSWPAAGAPHVDLDQRGQALVEEVEDKG